MATARVVMTDDIFRDLDEFQAELAPLGLELEVARPSGDEATLSDLARSATALHRRVTPRSQSPS